MSQNREYPMYIGGGRVKSSSPQKVLLPYDGSTVGTIFEADAAIVERAVASAKAAAPVMREMSLDERAAILRKAGDRLMARKDEFGKAISGESGKPIKEGRLEVDRAAYTLLFSSEEAHRLKGEVVPMDASPSGAGHMAMTVREPLGVIAAITPFNFPLNLAMHKIGPALAGGNSVVHKPASATPISALMMAEVFYECGLPEGALNVITGPGGSIGEQLVFHKDVAMITFTGSPEVGMRLRNLAGMKRVTLELGNNSAVIVESDANLEEAAARCVAGSFAHSGQVCISVQRIFVQQDVRAPFVERVVELTGKLKLGHPQDPSTDISSLITEKEAERVENWIGEAVVQGAHLRTGGKRSHASLEPAVLTDVPAHAQIARREVFGPVVGINSYGTLDEAIQKVNDSDYGLQAGIYTRDLGKAFYAARKVHVGGFMINEIPQYRVDQMPYGGVKLSGLGREGPKYAIEEMTESKLICWKTN
ncbi:MAG TPA: aldehyde dehydrogenase family protein [Bryobacteraceae bacterium]|nr:aldehyde dehydrogenase family protein [Bryobacteraceae bacterium]